MSKDIKRLENSWSKLETLYRTLQLEYNKMRRNHTIIAVLSQRLQGEVSNHENKITGLQAAKVSLEMKIEMLEKKLDSKEAEQPHSKRIRRTVSHTLSLRMRESDASSAWAKLCQVHEQKSEASKIGLQRQFFAIKMERERRAWPIT